MSIENYIRPQLTIAQELQILEDGELDRLNAIVVGPAYHVSEAEDATRAEYISEDLVIPYDAETLDNYTMDIESVRVFAEDLEAEIADYEFFIRAPENSNKLQLVDNSTGPDVKIIQKGKGTGFLADNVTNIYRGREVQIGDVIYIAETKGIDQIDVVKNGLGYTAGTVNVVIEGDGTGATATATVNPAGYISAIVVTSVGSGYTYATVKLELIPGTTKPTAEAEIALPENYFAPVVRRNIVGLEGQTTPSSYDLPEESTANPNNYVGSVKAGLSTKLTAAFPSGAQNDSLNNFGAHLDGIVPAPSLSYNPVIDPLSNPYNSLRSGVSYSGIPGDKVTVTIVSVDISAGTAIADITSESGVYDASKVQLVKDARLGSTLNSSSYYFPSFTFDGLLVSFENVNISLPDLIAGDKYEFTIKGEYIRHTLTNASGEITTTGGGVVSGGQGYTADKTVIQIEGNGVGAQAVPTVEQALLELKVTNRVNTSGTVTYVGSTSVVNVKEGLLFSNPSIEVDGNVLPSSSVVLDNKLLDVDLTNDGGYYMLPEVVQDFATIAGALTTYVAAGIELPTNPIGKTEGRVVAMKLVNNNSAFWTSITAPGIGDIDVDTSLTYASASAATTGTAVAVPVQTGKTLTQAVFLSEDLWDTGTTDLNQANLFIQAVNVGGGVFEAQVGANYEEGVLRFPIRHTGTIVNDCWVEVVIGGAITADSVKVDPTTVLASNYNNWNTLTSTQKDGYITTSDNAPATADLNGGVTTGFIILPKQKDAGALGTEASTSTGITGDTFWNPVTGNDLSVDFPTDAATFSPVVGGTIKQIIIPAAGFGSGISTTTPVIEFVAPTRAYVPDAPVTGGISNLEEIVNLGGGTPWSLTDINGDFDHTHYDWRIGGAITGVTLVNAGKGYTADPTIKIIDLNTGNKGSGAVIALFAVKDANDPLQVFIKAGGYSGPYDTTYAIRIIEGGEFGIDTIKAQVFETRGFEDAYEVEITPNNKQDLGTYGLQFMFRSPLFGTGGLRKNDVYLVDVTAEVISTTIFDTLLLDGPSVDFDQIYNFTTDRFKISLRTLINEEIPRYEVGTGIELFTPSSIISNGVAFKDNYYVVVPTFPTADNRAKLVSGVGELYTTYRALGPAGANEGYIKLYDESDVIEKLGKIVKENDLAYGAKWALKGANGKPVFALRVNGVDAEAFGEALKKIEFTDLTYALAVITEDTEVKTLVESHVNAMSDKEVQNFRRVYLGVDSPGQYKVLSEDSEGNTLRASVELYNGVYKRVKISPSAGTHVGFIGAGIVKGDYIRLNFRVQGGIEVFDKMDTSGNGGYKVAEVLNADELILEEALPAQLFAVRFEAWRANTAQSQLEYVINAAKIHSDRRVVSVWVENGLTVDSDGTLTPIENKFVAAEIAGLRSALLPQQGLTRTEITSVVSAPSMYLKYTREQLDEIASNGTFIITQDSDDGDVYIRHQLTTDVNNGSLYYEDSVGVNVDDVSFRIKDRLQGLIGKVNVNNRTVIRIKNIVSSIMDELLIVPDNSSVGSQIISYTTPQVAIHPTFKDRITVRVPFVVALPLNGLEVTVVASVTI